MKAFTDAEQSKKLAEFLPLESADMCYPPYYVGDENGDHLYYSLPLLECKEKCACHRDNKDEYIPCWSLAALLNILPSASLDSSDDHYFRLRCKERFSEWHDNPIDACYEMILKLHELNIL